MPLSARKIERFLPQGWTALARRLARSQEGGISVEFAFLAPVLMALAVGAADFGRLSIRYAEAESAASAAIQYATQNQANVLDTAGMSAAALAETNSDSMTVDASAPFCQCAGSSPQSCSVACPDGNYAPMYLTVTVHDSLELMFPYPGISQMQDIVVSNEGRVH